MRPEVSAPGAGIRRRVRMRKMRFNTTAISKIAAMRIPCAIAKSVHLNTIGDIRSARNYSTAGFDSGRGDGNLKCEGGESNEDRAKILPFRDCGDSGRHSCTPGHCTAAWFSASTSSDPGCERADSARSGRTASAPRSDPKVQLKEDQKILRRDV